MYRFQWKGSEVDEICEFNRLSMKFSKVKRNQKKPHEISLKNKRNMYVSLKMEEN